MFCCFATTIFIAICIYLFFKGDPQQKILSENEAVLNAPTYNTEIGA